jgi:hypothetical protein
VDERGETLPTLIENGSAIIGTAARLSIRRSGNLPLFAAQKLPLSKVLSLQYPLIKPVREMARNVLLNCFPFSATTEDETNSKLDRVPRRRSTAPPALRHSRRLNPFLDIG